MKQIGITWTELFLFYPQLRASLNDAVLATQLLNRVTAIWI
ncbi:hypothetical protein PRUB_a0419 [Pseudoalteromonas rubra]|uniref:Uncharacterized protein n=1 Tax=Pseudoalteromonas rubra TaxID=43658 RepID=A0A8T0C5V0_9GAMM|nr:hypothetical protein PRUB_a0419 [Pseudoalteromonas rubra]